MRTFVLENWISAENSNVLVPLIIEEMKRQIPAGHVYIAERVVPGEMFDPESPIHVSVFYREAANDCK